MIEQKNFPSYLPDDSRTLKNRVSFMLTYEQVLMIASALRLLARYISMKNWFDRLFFNPHVTEAESGMIEAIHHSCINCALSQEAYYKTKEGSDEK